MSGGAVPSAHIVVDDVDTPVLDEDDARHLHSVLRIRGGERVSVTDGKGGYRDCVYAGSGRLDPAGDVVVVAVARPAPEVTVAFAPVKGDRPDWAIQKLTEVGVDRVVLMRTERSVVRWNADRAEAHVARLRRVARAALMQSRGCWLPEIDGVFDFAQVVDTLPGAALASPGGAPPSLEHAAVLVGPEGGWSATEEQSQLPRVSLGPTVLRAETAAVAAGVLLVGLRSGLVEPARATEPVSREVGR